MQPNDIALVRLRSELELDSFTVTSVKLPNEIFNETGSGVVSGWGTVDPYGILIPDYLQYAEVDIIDANCKTFYKLFYKK